MVWENLILLVTLPAVEGDAGLPLPTGLEHPGPWLRNVEKGTDVHGSVGPESRKKFSYKRSEERGTVNAALR